MYQSIRDDLDRLRTATDQMRADGIAYARAEAAYQSAKAQRALELRAGGEPAAMVNLRIKGDEAVNSYLMERECAKAIYESDRELINTLKTAIRVCENQLQREWQG